MIAQKYTKITIYIVLLIILPVLATPVNNKRWGDNGWSIICDNNGASFCNCNTTGSAVLRPGRYGFNCQSNCYCETECRSSRCRGELSDKPISK